MNWSVVFSHFWQPESPYVLGLVLLLAAALFGSRPQDRRIVINTVGFYVLGLAGQFLSAFVGGMDFSQASIILFEIFTIVCGIACIRLMGFFIFRVCLPLLRYRPPRIVEDLVIVLGYAVLGLARLRHAGLDLGGVLATSAVVTAVLAFAMQDTLGNVLGGLAIQLDNSIEIGNWVKVDDVSGRVTDIRWRSTSMETRSGETVVIPNSVLMKGKFYVLGKREGWPLAWRRSVLFEVDPRESPRRISTLVESTVQEAVIPNVAKEPLPSCVLLAFENGNLRFGLRYWLTDPGLDDPTDSMVRMHILAALQRAGMRVAEAQQKIRLVNDDEQRAQFVMEREISLRLAALKNVDLLSTLNDDERRHVAQSLLPALFLQGDVVTRQGAVAHWLYIIVSGEVDVLYESPGGEKTLLDTFGPGRFFGEMGMMTGAPRSATVVARTDVECFRLDKEAFQALIHTRPALAEEISVIMVSRQTALEKLRQTLSDEHDARSNAERQSALLFKIRNFFGLST